MDRESSADLAAVLDDELSRLPDNLRDPVVLCLVEGQTYEQAATALGGSTRTLRRRLDRAKALLRLRLERRGVVPVVALELISSLDFRSSAVSPELARRAMDVAFQFLTGGGVLTPAAVVAKGVMGSMTRLNVSVLMAASAAVLIGLGIVWADDVPTGGSQPTLPTTARTQAPTPAAPVAPQPIALEHPPVNPPRPAQANPGTRGPDFTYFTGNDLVVSAPSQSINRVIAREAEFQLLEMSQTWLAKKWSRAWGEKCEIKVTIEEGAGSGTTNFDFNDPGPTLNRRALIKVRMELRGSLEAVLSNHLPREMARTVLACYCGKPVAPWAEAGVVALSTLSDEEQAALDARCRKLLADNHTAPLIALFRMTKPAPTEPSQEYSIVRYLLTRQPNADVGSIIYTDGNRLRCVQTEGEPFGTDIIPFDAENRHESLLAFVRVGMIGNTPESWNRAAKEVYGVESVDWLERAWKGWLDNPKSVLMPKTKPSVPGSVVQPETPVPGPSGSPLIPPAGIPQPTLPGLPRPTPPPMPGSSP
jgi:hypothetical protein